MIAKLSVILLAALSASSSLVAAHFPKKPSISTPLVTIRNGTVRGIHNAKYNQDFFLGIPYAQPPVGNLRFDTPKSLNTSFPGGMFNANAYGNRCFGVNNTYPAPESEDCLTLNIVRPSDDACKGKKLPVFVWIYGGGFNEGGSSNPLYNLTYPVAQSVKLGKPFIGVTFNYRVTAFGFLGGTVLSNAGITNMGLRDQRLFLHWLQENIAAFGGDPNRVTVGGESAGGFSMGIHSLAYNGRNDKLFHGLIMDSGSALLSGRYSDLPSLDEIYNILVASVGCGASPDTLACLRQIPYEYLTPVVTALQNLGAIWRPVVDGDLIADLSSTQLKTGRFVHVPILVGAATDEGTIFVNNPSTGTYGVQDDAQLIETLQLMGGPQVPSATLTEILKLYPDNPVLGNPGGSPVRFSYPYLYQYKRTSAIATDGFYVSGRILTARAWAKAGVPAYSWRWNTLLPDHPFQLGVTHASDTTFWFGNIDGIAQTLEDYNLRPLTRRQNYLKLASLMTKMLVSFVSDSTPNHHGVPGVPSWPAYSLFNPKNIVFDGNTTIYAYPEPDTFRLKQNNFWIDHALEFYH
ncbi:Cholinesterase [Orbilia brochopaga]|nr:Cholinesterase [Drechslerella brochopaga]